jgi:hypothetical protein
MAAWETLVPPETPISAPGWRWLVALVATALVAPWLSIGGLIILASIVATDDQLADVLVDRLKLFYLLGGPASVVATGAFALWYRLRGSREARRQWMKYGLFCAAAASVVGTAAAIALKNFVFAVPDTTQSAIVVTYLEIIIALASIVPLLLVCCLSAGPLGALLFVKFLHGRSQGHERS